MYEKVTQDIRVSADPVYLDDQSDPDEDHYVWAYTIVIENLGDEPVQLINRAWEITDNEGQMQAVQGAGVVGEQPVINVGEAFQYTSGTVLSANSGYMVGTYEMEYLSRPERFDVDIPAFSLDSPQQVQRPN